MSQYQDQETIVNHLDWNQFSLEQLKKIQSQVSQAISCKQKSLSLNENKTSPMYHYQAGLAKVCPRHLCNSLADYQSCVFLISLGSKNFMDTRRLKATIEWISDNFRSCTVIIGDSLYRLTLEVRHQSTAETALQAALQTGQEFIKQNQSYFYQYAQKCDFQFKRTSEIEKISQFLAYYQQVQELYQNEPSFQELVNRFAYAYLHRGKAIHIDQEHQQKSQEIALVTTYFLEESAILACLVEAGDSVFVYPGAIKTFEEISEGLHPEVPEPLQRMIWVSLRLKKTSKKTREDRVMERH
ncbi:tRNA-dependent cyclodipeptide synthase [Roseofilum sp. Guam]|uniref:tRNA-dependent cyclodipeptide synthase n=1 Tax=Roseofilum sp. Guam TaxID=2821502 RepID=UPI001B1FDB02|nr:tRNA-dependent cyclodipeptide synthase [Roseofilum sp. Guam]MBP0029308.1 tRNA-dependent cyclodipeptide synthase [Roseofilum sp. Guam]